MTTEQPNPNSTHIDNLSTVQMMTTINQEDAKVAKAIETVIPQIALAVDAITEAIRNGGRLLYIGAGTSEIQKIIIAKQTIKEITS